MFNYHTLPQSCQIWLTKIGQTSIKKARVTFTFDFFTSCSNLLNNCCMFNINMGLRSLV